MLRGPVTSAQDAIILVLFHSTWRFPAKTISYLDQNLLSHVKTRKDNQMSTEAVPSLFQAKVQMSQYTICHKLPNSIIYV